MSIKIFIVVAILIMTGMFSKCFCSEHERMLEKFLSIVDLMSMGNANRDYKDKSPDEKWLKQVEESEAILYGIDKMKEEEGMMLCIDLLDYGLDAAWGEMLSEQITKYGDKILPLLIDKKNTPSKPIEKYIKYFRPNDKYVMIDSCINSIKNGEIQYKEYPDNILRDALKRKAEIEIFLKDYQIV